MVYNIFCSRYNDTKKFKPVTLPGQEAAADYQVCLYIWNVILPGCLMTTRL